MQMQLHLDSLENQTAVDMSHHSAAQVELAAAHAQLARAHHEQKCADEHAEALQKELENKQAELIRMTNALTEQHLFKRNCL